MSTGIVPDTHTDLLERPLFGHLGTLRDDGSPQVNPMWFGWDGAHLRFTTTRGRRKARNVERDPRVVLSVHDPDRPYRYLEVRGRVVRTDADPGGEFFGELARRYGLDLPGPPEDAAERVVLVVEPTASSRQ